MSEYFDNSNLTTSLSSTTTTTTKTTTTTITNLNNKSLKKKISRRTTICCDWWFLFVALLFANFIIAIESEELKKCASCSLKNFEEYKQIRQEQILNDLLQKLSLTSKPNVTFDYDNLPPLGLNNPRIQALVDQSKRENNKDKQQRIRRSTRSLYESQNNDETVNKEYYPYLYEHDAELAPQVTYILSEPHTKHSYKKRSQRYSRFNLATNLRNKYIKRATLHVFIERPNDEDLDLDLPIDISVHMRYDNGTIGDPIAAKHILIRTDASDTQARIPLEDMDIQEWIQNNKGKNGGGKVDLHVKAIHNNKNLFVYPINGINDRMFLELEMLEETPTTRNRRHAIKTENICQVGSNTTNCCLYDLIIDFEKVGWDFVVAPKRYNAYICSGICTPSQISLTPRGSIAQQAHVDYLQCCHPKEYAGITVVYVTENTQVWVKEVPGMIARKCGCA